MAKGYLRADGYAHPESFMSQQEISQQEISQQEISQREISYDEERY